jgi:hypothetical protein
MKQQQWINFFTNSAMVRDQKIIEQNKIMPQKTNRHKHITDTNIKNQLTSTNRTTTDIKTTKDHK